MSIKFTRRQWIAGSLAAALVPSLGVAEAQSFRDQPGERTVSPEVNTLDKEDTWTLTFRFKNPRVLTAEVPGRGKKVIWYMWYQVLNFTDEPHVFNPDFELVTLDRNTVHTDEILPSVQEQIRKIEDPTGHFNIKNSVTISKEPIPVSRKDALPRAVTGVAIWSDVHDRAPDTAMFSVFVAGLSSGSQRIDDRTILRKTLQLNFRRFSDAKRTESVDIRFDDSLKGGENPKWIYRATLLPSGRKNGEPKKEEAKDGKELGRR